MFGVRGHVRALELGDMSPSRKAVTCHRTPNFHAASFFRFLRASAKNDFMYSPTPDEFLKLAAQGNVIPVTRRLLADIETPLSAYRKIRGAGESFLFESNTSGQA